MAELVFGLSKIRESFLVDVEAKARSMVDFFWYRMAVTATARPYAMKLSSGKNVYLWKLRDGRSELWGGELFLDMMTLDLTYEEAEEFTYEVPKPFRAMGITHQPHAMLSPKRMDPKWYQSVFMVQHDLWEQFEQAQWSAKRRRKLNQEMRDYRENFRVVLEPRVSQAKLEWIVDRSVDAAKRQGVDSLLTNLDVLSSLKMLLGEAALRESCLCISVMDGDRLAACEAVVFSRVLHDVHSQYGYHDTRYDGLGKYLYEVLIRWAMQNKMVWISAGMGMHEVKKLYGYQALPTWSVEMKQ